MKPLSGENNPNWKGGVTLDIKKYHREHQAKWRKENREKVNAINRAYYHKHKEKELERGRNKYQRIKNKLRKTRKKWRENNKEKANFYSRQYQGKKKNGGTFTLKEWKNLKKQFKHTCPCCGKKEPEIKLEIDHIIPISCGGTNRINNIQPLCRSCNASKHTKIIQYATT